MNDKTLIDLLVAHKTSLASLAAEHEQDREAFNQRASKRQTKVTHIEGRIAQLEELLSPAPVATEQT
jgi:transcription elongation GreA/GreB family factor